MRLDLSNKICSALTGYLGLLLGLLVSVSAVATPTAGSGHPTVTAAVSFSNPCGLTPPTLTPSATTVTQGSAAVSVVATGCPGGIIQYFNNFGTPQGVYTIAPGGTISVPTSLTGTMVISALCSFSGCKSDVANATITINPASGPSKAPTVANPIPNQTGTIGTNFVYIVPSSTFSDPGNDKLTLTATGLPNGLTFNGDVISGPILGSGSSTITIIATNTKGLATSTSFILTVQPATVVDTSPFSITGVTTVSCLTVTASQRLVTFNPRYAGVTGQPISFSVVNEMLPTTNPGPYTLTLYTDNSAITTVAQQTGSPGPVSFVYNWLAGCTSSTSTANTAPTVANLIPTQTATLGQAFSYVIPATTFTDAQTPNGLTLSVSGLPAGLSFTAPSTISGTPSTTVGSPFTVTVKATDPGSLSTSTTFALIVSPTVVSSAFSITGITTVSCTTVTPAQPSLPPPYMVTFTPRYAGVTGQPISFSIVNEMLPTTNPGPYTRIFYRDNPVVTTVAFQTGSPGPVSFTYNWLAACTSTTSTANSAPTVANLIPAQTATLGQAYSYVIPTTTFTDAETPNGLTLSVSGLPAGLSFTAPSTISGTPSTTVGSPFTVTVKATDPGSLSTSTTFVLTISPTVVSSAFSITGITTVSCLTVTASRRLVTFNPRYAGVTGQPISFSVANEMLPTTNPGPYTLTLYTDNPVVTAVALQTGSPGPVSFTYNWLAACNSGVSGRLGIGPEQELGITILGNPTVAETVEIEISGAAGQPVWTRTLDGRGRSISESMISEAGTVERTTVQLGHSAGLYLLQVNTPTQKKVVKMIKR